MNDTNLDYRKNGCSTFSQHEMNTFKKIVLNWGEITLILRFRLVEETKMRFTNDFSQLFLLIVTRTITMNGPFSHSCCVFGPAFGCYVHPKSGRTTFFQPFSTFFVHFKRGLISGSPKHQHEKIKIKGSYKGS